MFLFHLTPAERPAFFGLAKHLAVTDDSQDAAETEALARIQEELGIPVSNLPALAPTPEVLSTFVSTASKASVVLELVALAYADGVPHAGEMEVLKSVAVGLGISELRLLEMENWVVQQMALSAEAKVFLTEEE
jgi:uncharacterized tellurite resistance protein B-like protein